MTKSDLLLLAQGRQWCADGTARRLREQRRLTLVELAAAAGTTDATVSRWESGVRRPRGAASFLRYAKLLESLASATGGGSSAA